MSLIRERLAIINSLKKAENSKIRSIKEHLDKKVILLMKIHKEREFYETAVKELQLAAKNLKETLLNLALNDKKKKLLPTGFARSKGKLPLPFNGKIMKNNHSLGPEILSIKRGIFIAGPMGARVKAVFPGRVDFSGLIKGYGETVVINHGSRFFTISAHLAHRNKEVGEMVERGDVIGLLGQADTFSGSRLYFEMRRAGINLDPLKWLKVD
jgi:septal ring factor EnvC (AmiA/AmiB activator)